MNHSLSPEPDIDNRIADQATRELNILFRNLRPSVHPRTLGGPFEEFPGYTNAALRYRRSFQARCDGILRYGDFTEAIKDAEFLGEGGTAKVFTTVLDGRKYTVKIFHDFFHKNLIVPRVEALIRAQGIQGAQQLEAHSIDEKTIICPFLPDNSTAEIQDIRHPCDLVTSIVRLHKRGVPAFTPQVHH